LGRDDDMFAVVREICPDIIALGYDQNFNEARLVEELNCRGLKVEVVRLEKHEDDLNGTRKIIGRIIDWYTVNKDQMEKEGRR
jgi:FAD synthetase